MNTESSAEGVRSFFSKHECAGLILPSGWVGRPFDHQYMLKRVEAVADRLLIELDEGEVLTFEGSVIVSERPQGLVLTGFSRLSWDWAGYVSPWTAHHSEYDAGKVEFVTIYR